MTSYKTDRARAAAQAAESAVYSRRRFASGFFVGLVMHIVLALALGLVLVDDVVSSVDVRLGSTTISCLIATPLVCALGFAIGLSGRLRKLGMGIVVGALAGTVLIVVPFLLLG
ncbi:hypothetical protein GCM10027447_24300 [Glycomyces halotolerans]